MPTLQTNPDAEKELDRRFESKLIINSELDRTLVSFQANKRQTQYRWFKYKEGFSASLIRYLLEKLHLESGLLLDPFADSGAPLFGAAKRGLDAQGIELLPLGCEEIAARKLAGSAMAPIIARKLQCWKVYSTMPVS